MRSGRPVKVAIVVAILLVGGAALALAKVDVGGGSNAAFKGAPMPPLFSQAQIGTVDALLRRARARAHRDARAWIGAHPVTNDAQFASWAVAKVGPPPGPKVTDSEHALLRRIAATRTPQGVQAAIWLEQHGKKQPWKAMAKQTKGFVADADYNKAKRALKTALDLGKTIGNAAKTRYDRRSPYVTDPKLSAGGVRVDVGGAQQSYPSTHMVDAGVGMAILGAVDPHLASEYRWMADEIGFSRLYGGGHYPSDLAAGMYLGTLIGDYERQKAGLGA